MAERLLTFDFTKPSDLTETAKANYPWDEWFDGDIWKLTEGDDFQPHPLMMERIIRTRATTRGAKVSLRHQPVDGSGPFGVLVLQRTDIPRPADHAGGLVPTPLDLETVGRGSANTAIAEQPDCTATTLAAGAPRCPVCTSWDVSRHVEGFRVWFTCRRCGAVFGQ